MTDNKPQIQEAQKTPSRITVKKIDPEYPDNNLTLQKGLVSRKAN